MPTKKDQILNSALSLFAKVGYKATTTQLIAQEAKVSEGLIYRHFNNKEDLLININQKRKKRIKLYTSPILEEKNPELRINKVISLPFEVAGDDKVYWQFQLMLKQELQNIDCDRQDIRVFESLVTAFTELEIQHPTFEAMALLQLAEATMHALFENKIPNPEEYKTFLINKYQQLITLNP